MYNYFHYYPTNDNGNQNISCIKQKEGSSTSSLSLSSHHAAMAAGIGGGGGGFNSGCCPRRIQ